MSLNVKLYTSTQPNAPTLSGTPASLSNLLSSVLFNGYNLLTLTSLVISSNVATATINSHGFSINDCILISGASPSALNAEWYITDVTTNTFTFNTTGISNQTATGTITVKYAPAGWINSLGYTQGGGNGLSFSADDSGSTTFARFWGEEVGGSPIFPTTAQFSGGMYINKSTTANGTARPWYIVANDRVIIGHINAASTANATDACMFYFGDLISYGTNDIYGTLIIGQQSTTAQSSNNMHLSSNSVATSANGHYICRKYDGTGSSITAGKFADYAMMNLQTTIGGGGNAFPWLGVTNNVLLSEIWANENVTSIVRGKIPGLWCPLHNKPLTHGDTFEGAAGSSIAGKKFLVLNQYNASQIFVEISNTWYN